MDKTNLQPQLKNAHDAFGLGLAGAILLQQPQAWPLLEKMRTAQYNTVEVNLREVVTLLKHQGDRKLVLSELMKLLLRSTVSEGFERVEAYCQATSQMDTLRRQPWYLFAKLVRNSARHSHATLLLKAGVQPKIVSEGLGHASIGITLDTYSHVLPGLQKKAAECFDNLVERKNVGKMSATGSSSDSVGR